MQKTKCHQGHKPYSSHWPLSGAKASRTALNIPGFVILQQQLPPASAVTLFFPGTGVSSDPFPPHFCFHQSTDVQVVCRLSPSAPSWLDALLSLQTISFCANQVPVLQGVQNPLRSHSKTNSIWPAFFPIWLTSQVLLIYYRRICSPVIHRNSISYSL